VWITYCYESFSGKSFQARFVLAYGNQGHRADSRNLQGLSVRNKTPKKPGALPQLITPTWQLQR
jgi:hypothetical protein